VFVVVPDGEEKAWLMRLHAGRAQGRVTDAFAFARAATGERWFKCLEVGWNITFLRNSQSDSEAHLVAHHGERWRAFALVFESVGTVICADAPNSLAGDNLSPK
jgi:hypothetical protein